MAESIPADLIRNILARLPVKDFLRIRCVSKFFRSLIDCPYFGKLHLIQSQKIQPHLYGVSYLVRFGLPQQRLFDVSNSTDNVSVVDVNQPPGSELTDFWVVVGTCNGLIASSLNSSKDREHIMFWNPFTGRSKKVVSSMPHNGFGYDHKSDEYKLVRIAVFHDSENNPNRVILKTAIYSLRSNSWKEIGDDFVVNSGFYNLDFGVLSNNALHWVILTKINDRKIVAFDLVKEEFYYVPVYGSFRYNGGMKLNVLDGCLAMSFKYRKHNYIWVMREYGVEKSWTELLSYLRSELKYSDFVTDFAYSSKRDKVLLSSNNCWYWYDLNSKKLDCCSDKNINLSTSSRVKLFSGSLLAPDDLVDLKRKQTFLKYNKETEEKRRKLK